MTQRSLKVNTLVLVGAIVLHLALPFTTGVVCSLPEAQDATALLLPRVLHAGRSIAVVRGQ